MPREPGNRRTARKTAPAAVRRPRRRQEDRSREMRGRLMDATLRCLRESGYAGLSISHVAEAARVSRGAVLHHYATKFDLAAAAIRHFFETRYDRLQRLTAAGDSGRGLDERLDAFRGEISTLFPLNLEIINILRTDPALREAVLDPHEQGHEERVAGYKAMFPELPGDLEREIFISVLVAFLRGLGVESLMRGRDGESFVEGMFEMFRRMVHLYFASAGSQGRASGPG
jgi:AcrR family transcriptional regulator